MKTLKDLNSEELLFIGNILGYVPNVAKSKARRFIEGLSGTLTNWKYDETINYGDMCKVVKIINYLLDKGYDLKQLIS